MTLDELDEMEKVAAHKAAEKIRAERGWDHVRVDLSVDGPASGETRQVFSTVTISVGGSRIHSESLFHYEPGVLSQLPRGLTEELADLIVKKMKNENN